MQALSTVHETTGNSLAAAYIFQSILCPVFIITSLLFSLLLVHFTGQIYSIGILC